MGEIKKRLLVLIGPGGPFPISIFHSLKPLEVEIDVIALNENDEDVSFIENAFRELFTGDFYYKKRSLIVDWAKKISQKSNYNGVVTYTESLIMEEAEIGSYLKTSGKSVASVKLTQSKFKQRKKLYDKGVSKVQAKKIESVKDVEELDETFFPLVMKPEQGTSSFSVVYCENKNELRSCFLDFLDRVEANPLKNMNKVAVVESFINGSFHPGVPELGDYVSVESLVFNDEVFNLAIMDKFGLSYRFTELGDILPSQLPQDFQNKVTTKVSDAIRALGLNNTAVHTELKLLDNDCEIIEVNARVGGVSAVMLEKSADYNFILNIAKVALGEMPDTLIEYKRYATFHSIVPPSYPVEIVSHNSLESIVDGKTKLHCRLRYPVGGVVSAKNGQFLGGMLTVGNSFNEISSNVNDMLCDIDLSLVPTKEVIQRFEKSLLIFSLNNPIQYVNEAISLGESVTVLFNRDPLFLKNDDHKMISSLLRICPDDKLNVLFYRDDSELKHIVSTLVKKINVTGVLFTDDSSFRAREVLSGKVKLECMMEASAAVGCYDKKSQREMITSVGLKQPRVSSLASIKNKHQPLRYPYIVKPVSGEGHKNVQVIRTSDDERFLLDSDIELDSFLAEEMIVGDSECLNNNIDSQVSVELIVQDGELKFAFVCDNFLLLDSYREQGALTPSTRNSDVVKRIIEEAYQGVLSLGLKNIVSCVELKVTAEGPVIVEINARVGGGRNFLSKGIYGVNLIKNAVLLSLGKEAEVDEIKLPNNYGVCVFGNPIRDGKIKSIKNLDIIKKDNSNKVFIECKKVNQSVKVSNGLKDMIYIANFIINGDSEDAINKFNEVKEIIEVEYYE